LFAFASMYLSASYAVILNASASLWGGVFSAIWLGEHITLLMLAGCGLILIGTALVFRLLRLPGRRAA
jgi:drug/metabolite transporter (DMT)-like permease